MVCDYGLFLQCDFDEKPFSMRNYYSIKSMPLWWSSGLVFALCLVFAIFMSTSCADSSKKGRTNEDGHEATLDASDDSEETIDIPIAITISRPKIDDEEMEEEEIIEYDENGEVLERMCNYEVTRETEKDIYIDANSPYYKDYLSGHRIKVEKHAFYESYEDVNGLTIDIDIVNNTDERLSIDELDLKVEESTPDSIPVIYICTTETNSNCVYFVNQSWFNWKGFTFSYSILEKGESFNGEYKKQQHISYFDSIAIIDLLPDMKEMGYDYDELVDCVRRNKRIMYYEEDGYKTEPIIHNEYKNYFYFYLKPNDDDFLFYEEKFKPFGLKEEYLEYVGVATLYGSIKFDFSDFSVDFVAEISLSTSAGFGAFSEANDQYDAKFKSSGEDYTLRYPYTTVIEPYGAEMVKLSIVADKPSFHKFHIDIKNGNGLKIRSKNINFHYFHPKY